MTSLNEFRHCMQIASCAANYRSFFTEKTPENEKLSNSQTTWPVTYNWSYKIMKNLGPFDDAEKTCSHTDPSDLPGHLTLNIIYFWT